MEEDVAEGVDVAVDVEGEEGEATMALEWISTKRTITARPQYDTAALVQPIPPHSVLYLHGRPYDCDFSSF